MRVLIVDDEAPARTRLRGLLDEIGNCQVVGEAASGTEAVRLAEQLTPEVLLLDIRMPGMDGLEAARHLARLRNPPAVIFTTAYDQHALEAFRARAVDYLLKPIRLAHLQRSLDRARRPNRAQLAAMQDLETDDRETARSHLCVRVRGNLQLIPVSEILYFVADQKYVNAHYGDGEVLIEESLKSLEEEFGERFVRIHRNALVARQRLVGLEKGENGQMTARIQGTETCLEVSRRHLPAVRRWLKERG